VSPSFLPVSCAKKILFQFDAPTLRIRSTQRHLEFSTDDDNTVPRPTPPKLFYQEVGLSRNDSAQLVDVILEEVSRALLRDEWLKLSSLEVSVRSKGERIGRQSKDR